MKYVIAAHLHHRVIYFPVFSQSNSVDGATWAEVFQLDETASS